MNLYDLLHTMISFQRTDPRDINCLIGAFFQSFNHSLNFLCGYPSFAGQGADFISYYSKTAPLLASPCCLYRSVERE